MYKIIKVTMLALLIMLTSNKTTGQDNINQTISTATLSESMISTAIQKYILDIENCESWQVEIECGHLPTNLPTFNTTAPLQVSCLKRGSLVGRTIFKVSYKSLSGNWISFQISCNVKRFMNVLVASRRLDRGHIISGNELYQEKREVTNTTYDACSNLPSTIGRHTKRIVSAGSILTESMIEVIPVVQRGDNVTAFMQKKNLMISFPAKANQPGYIGDVITVRDMSNNTLVKAEVINHETVIVKM